MTTLVVDASFLVAALLDPGRLGSWAADALASKVLAAPHIVVAEAATVLRRSALNRVLASEEATSAHADLLAFRLELYPYAPFADRIWQLRATVTPYDGCYVALAEALDAPLATLDLKLARAPGPRCEFLTPP